MNSYFQGTIQKVDIIEDRLVLRCVREFFYQDGFKPDDILTWEIDRPVEMEIYVRLLTGKSVDYFEVKEEMGQQTLLISHEVDYEPISIQGTCVRKREESYTKDDLISVISVLSRRLDQFESDSLALHRKLTSIESFIKEKIERIRRRVQFEAQRESGKAAVLDHEIEDLNTILTKLKAPASPRMPEA
jgi:hypothetical protein